jgi:uncharacterized protein involved in outer membrane biogenesis
MIRGLIRFVISLITLAVILIVAAILLKDAIVKEVMQNRIRRVTGMDARIGQVDVTLLTPTLTIDDLKLYNPPDFGGSLCLKMPELHVEYDANAARAGKVRLSLMRLNVSEIDVVQDKKGRINFDAVAQNSTQGTNKSSAAHTPSFDGIDTLNLTLGTLRWTSLATGHQRVYQLGIKDQVFHGIKSEADLAAMVALATATNSNWNMSDLMGSLFGR